MIPQDLASSAAVSAPAPASTRSVAPVESMPAIRPEGEAFAALLTEGEDEPEADPDATPDGQSAQAAATQAPVVLPLPALTPGAIPAETGGADAQAGEGDAAPAAAIGPAAAAKGAAAAPGVAPAAPQAAGTPPAPEGAVVAAAEAEAAQGPEAPRAATKAQAAEGTGPPAASAPASAPAVTAILPAEGSVWRLAQAAGGAALGAAHGTRTAARPKDVAEQITLAMVRSAEPELELRLDPPELGRVQIRLSHGDGGLQAVVLADRPETQDFLRRNAEALHRELTEAGYAEVSLEFAAGQDAPARDRMDEARRVFAAGLAEAAPLAPAAAAPSAAGADGLDIRL